MRREVVGYVIREGKVRGQGRYEVRDDISVFHQWSGLRAYALVTNRERASVLASSLGGRVVAVVRKAKASKCDICPKRHADCVDHTRMLVEARRERDIDRADQKRAEESKAAAWEQVRGLQMRVKEIEGTCVALGNKIHAARKALG